MSYDPGILPLAAGVLLAGIVCIVFRSRFAKASNGTYQGAGIDKLVFAQAKLEKGMVIAGVVLITASLGVALAGFFV
ncbi:hypothetical protein [Kineococcus sp. SYSU DK005]|uniref:hypothetical protein n=1 Tax=Kineococcus sp. SYSU DK005 TaxID=3383126 RepID=UPI003D7C9672